jgi:hypothetical protein
MFRRALWALAVPLLLALAVPAHAQESYLDVEIIRVKPDKTAEFDAITKKMVDANRRNNGDRWLAMESVYGEGNVVLFISTRSSYADVDKGSDAFTAALNKAFGKEATDKLFNDLNSCIASSRSELRRRRWDLSRKVPTDPAALAKLVGEARFLRTTAVRVRPGRIADFEALLKDTKAAGEQNANAQPLLISQVVEGSRGTVFYVSALRSSLAGFDNNPTTREILGDEGYKKFLQANADDVDGSDSTLYRFSPELSNPPDEYVAAAPDFWRPKAAAPAAAPKPKPAAKPAGEKPKP